jgi:ribosomal protein S6--L-glutamate ligase
MITEQGTSTKAQTAMRLCFIVEERYRADGMPLAVVDQLRAWGHDVTVLEPQSSATCLSEFGGGAYDAVVLKTVSDGPGLSILEAAAALGVTTINDPGAIRMVRDKAVAAAVAQAHGLPFPRTWFLTDLRLLDQIPASDYPLVVKPSNGSACRSIHLLHSPADLPALRDAADSEDRFFLAQQYMANPGHDVKLYNTGREIYATVRRSPLHPDEPVSERLVPLTPELRRIAAQVGRVFGLDIYGVDVVETPDGWMILDINDFPSFGLVPGAVRSIAQAVLELAARAAGLPVPAEPRDTVAAALHAVEPATTPERGEEMEMEMEICLLTDRPDHPVLAAAMEQLRRRHRVRVVDPQRLDAAAVERELRAPADLYLLKSHTPAALAIAHRLEGRGVPVLNGALSTARCLDRVALARLLEGSGLPTPRTWNPGRLRSLATQHDLVFPLIVKSRHSRRGDLVTRVDDAAGLATLLPQWGDEPVVAQEFLPGDGWDVKLWVTGETIFGAHRRTPLEPGASRETVAIPDLPAEWVRILERIGSVFDLSLFGVDLLLTERGPMVIDVNAFPGFRGVPGAAEALAALVESSAGRRLQVA